MSDHHLQRKAADEGPGAGGRGRGSRQRPYSGGEQEAVGRAEPLSELIA